MKKVIKEIQFATKYQEWLAKNEPHGNYTSSNGEYYHDIIAELLVVQQGLCAYTEHKLVSSEQLATLKNGFSNGKFDKTKYNIEAPIHLEHFNKDLKPTRCWLWDNLFVVFSVINGRGVKGTKPVDGILKPDTATYNPFTLLSYDRKEHKFYPAFDLDKGNAQRVTSMINTLGLNYGYIVNLRRDYLENVLVAHSEENPQSVYQFPTAFAFCKELSEKVNLRK